MKSDSKEFYTRMTVPEIASVLRSFKCNIQSLTQDALSSAVGETRGDIEVLMHGKASFLDAAKHAGAGKSEWAVQVYVYDLGDVRQVELVALGESALASAANAYSFTGGKNGYVQMANMYVNFRHSKDYRDRIMARLNPINECDLQQPEEPSAPQNTYTTDQFTKNSDGMNIQNSGSNQSSYDNEVFYMVANGMAAQNGGICINGTVESGELIQGQKIEIAEIDTQNSYPSVASKIYKEGMDTYIVDDSAGEISVLTDFVFIPFAAGTKLIVCKSGELSKALAAYSAALVKVTQKPETSQEDNMNQSADEEMSFYDDAKPDENQVEPEQLDDEDSGFKLPALNNKVLLAIIGVLAVALIFLIIHSLVGGDEEPALATDDPEYSDETDDTSTAETGFHSIDQSYITVLSSDWDWDSSEYDSDTGIYRVDAVLYVKNNSDEPLVEIDFKVDSQEGDAVFDGNSGSDTFYAYGLVKPGERGFLVADVYTDEEKIRPDDTTYVVSEAFANSYMDTYVVPYGKITDNYGPDNDYYDISVDNPNDVEVSEYAKVVAVRTKGDALKEGEASGHLTGSIPAGASGFEQTRAFDNPNLHSKYEEMTVYIIDINYLLSE